MLLPDFEYLAPENAEELCDLLEKYQEKAKILAGGTDLLPNLLNNLYKVDYLINIDAIDEMKGIFYEEGKGVIIGTATTMKEIENSPLIREKYPALSKAAGEVGSPQIRSMATIGGNCCNASPSADAPPALVVLGAKVIIQSKEREREILLEEFILGNRSVDLQPDEYLEKLIIPDIASSSANRFDLITLSKGVEIDIVSLAVHLALNDQKKVEEIKIAMGAVAPIPLRAKSTEKLLTGQNLSDDLMEKAAELCASESKPIDDIRGSAKFRKHLIKVLALRTIKETLAAIR